MWRLLRAIIRRRRRNEQGQALPLAAVGIFAMALGVLATLNLGQAVHQKIKLQNAADSAAYSLAAMEARTFNYIAFLNRAQIAHYNTAMVVQSYMTWVGFQVALFGTAVDMLAAIKDSVEFGASWCCTPPYCIFGCLYKIARPGVVYAFNIAKIMRQFSVMLYRVGEQLGHWIVEAMSIFNNAAVWQTQFARAALLNGHILTGMQSYVTKNDPDISFTQGKSRFMNMFINMALNSIEYYQAFDNASGINPYALAIPFDMFRVSPSGKYTKHSDKGAEDAYRIMTELCHATRTPKFVSNRRGNPTPATTVYTTVFVQGNKMGQTKFTNKGDMNGAEISAIESEGNYQIGQYLSSDDYATQVLGLGMAPPAPVLANYSSSGSVLGDAIAAYESDGKHYKYGGGKDSGLPSPGGKGLTVGVPPPRGGTEDTMEEKNHAPWPGFAPFFKFKPNKERTSDFNQPSTWIFLNKHHEDFQSRNSSLGGGNQERAPWYANFSFRHGSREVKLDTTIGGSRNSYLFEGLNVISRGMAYYHRPGNWTEHPNFFNPFWRARLAPVGQKLQNFWDSFVTKNISTGSSNPIIQGAVNLLRNAQMDLFTAVITSIITH